MRRRTGRPGLVGTMARTAVVAGTATAVSGNVARRQQASAAAAQAEAEQREATQQQAAESQAQIAAMQSKLDALPTPSAPGSAGPGPEDMVGQLERLGSLKASGLLTDSEFAAAKATLLGI